MPAAAVIPAPIAYTKVVAVKKLVVEFGPDLRNGLQAFSEPGSILPPDGLLVSEPTRRHLLL